MKIHDQNFDIILGPWKGIMSVSFHYNNDDYAIQALATNSQKEEKVLEEMLTKAVKSGMEEVMKGMAGYLRLS